MRRARATVNSGLSGRMEERSGRRSRTAWIFSWRKEIEGWVKGPGPAGASDSFRCPTRCRKVHSPRGSKPEFHRYWVASSSASTSFSYRTVFQKAERSEERRVGKELRRG